MKSIIPNPLPCLKMRLRSLVPLLFLPLLASANPQDRVVSGYYTVDWEVQSFRPCGGGGPWWVANPGPMMVNYRDLVENEYGTIFVTVRAEVSEPGRWGHMGGYRRMMGVLEVREARLPSGDEDDCSRIRDAE
jgi:hypothetical protein